MAQQRSCGKVMFSQVCQSVYKGGGGSHVTITHAALDLTVHRPSPPTPPLARNMRQGDPTTLSTQLVTSADHHVRPVQACSLYLTVHPPTDIRLQLKELQSAEAGSMHPTIMLFSQ